jgi:nucleotide-binding universal stress UspA family protein
MTTKPVEPAEHRIVVGVDGSAASKAALAWAIRRASLTGAVVVAVTAWAFPDGYGYPVITPPIEWQKVANKVVTAAISQVSARNGDVPIRSEVVKGNAARALVAVSAGADLLVVGNRGHSGIVEALLGSTAQRCVQHASCPVVVIRAAKSLAGRGQDGT